MLMQSRNAEVEIAIYSKLPLIQHLIVCVFLCTQNYSNLEHCKLLNY